GSPASVEEIDGRNVTFSVGCDSHDEAYCIGYQSLTTFPTRKAAIAAWNKRSGEGVVTKDADEALTEIAAENEAARDDEFNTWEDGDE
ncbi:hypothetical protein, partial [Mesorhizobium sp. M8A.F.Ca.ET.208.01.1.1]